MQKMKIKRANFHVAKSVEGDAKFQRVMLFVFRVGDV